MHGALSAQVVVQVAKPAAPALEPRAILQLGNAADGRAAMVKKHGVAVVAIEQGLRWLTTHQDEDGRWNADEFMAHDPDGKTDGAGGATQDVGLTGLAVFALAREGTAAKPRHAAILRGVKWLVQQQAANGRVGSNETQDYVYGHAMATLGLWAAAAATGSAEARAAAEKGQGYLDKHRNPYGVWRYEPRDNDNDTSVTAWAVLCYLAASEQGCAIDKAALRAAAVWFDGVTDKTGRAGYLKAGDKSSRNVGMQLRFPVEHTEAMTAAALLCRLGLGQTEQTHPIVATAASVLVDKPPKWEPDTGKIDLYYWFFASEALRHFGGEPQKEWAAPLETALVAGQRVDGAFAGSWDPVDPWGQAGGRIYATALAVLSLQALAPFPEKAAPPKLK